MRSKLMVFAGLLALAETGFGQGTPIAKPTVNLAAWAGELDLSWAGSHFVKNLAEDWELNGNFVRWAVNPTGTIAAPVPAHLLDDAQTSPEQEPTSWLPVQFYSYNGSSVNEGLGAFHLTPPSPPSEGGPSQAPRLLGYFFRVPFTVGSVPNAPATSYTVSIDVRADYCHTPDAAQGYPVEAPLVRTMVRSTTRLTFAISKSPVKASSVDTRLAYGNPDATGQLIPDPNASLGHLAFRPYAFKGGLFIGRMPGQGKDKSGVAWIHAASPNLPAPPSGAFLMGRSLQLYCAESPQGATHTFEILPALTTSTFAEAFYAQPAITWGQRAYVAADDEETYRYSLEGSRRCFNFRIASQKTTAATGYSGLAIVPPNSLSSTGAAPPSATGVWRYFVQDGATPRVPAPAGVDHQPVTYNVYLLSGEVIRYENYSKDPSTNEPILNQYYYQ